MADYSPYTRLRRGIRIPRRLDVPRKCAVAANDLPPEAANMAAF